METDMHENQGRYSKKNTSSQIEEVFWKTLDLDKLEADMAKGSEQDRDVLFMGTGYTHNACYMCGSSAQTHGNAGCC